MPLSLHAATIPTALQILGSVAALLDKAEAHCQQQGLSADTLIGARLAPDMQPFAYQISSCAWHSARLGLLRSALLAHQHLRPGLPGTPRRK